jgi:alditol oxidase
MVERNWAGNIAYSAANFDAPATIAEVQSIVAAAAKVRSVGSRHSFNDIADTTGDLVWLGALPRMVELDTRARMVTVDGGIKYGELATQLHAAGWALANLASLPHISIAGACATATHGSGVGNGNLATAVQAMEIVTASGDLVDVSRDDDPLLMDAIAVGLGAFGIVASLTLAIEPTFEVQQRVYEHLPMTTALAQFDDIMAAGYSVSLFTSWRPDEIEQLWIKERVEPVREDAHADIGSDRFGAAPARHDMHPIAVLSAEPCTEQMGVAGPWHERLPHFRMGFTPSSGDELQSELFVGSAEAPEAMQILVGLHDVLAPVMKISEVRTVAADSLWMSPAYRRDCVAFHFTWVPSWADVQPVLAQLESALAPFAPRPHWGKLTTLPGEVIRPRVERMAEFERLVAEWDPDRKFRNDYLAALFG